jgi:hypothetical protein
MRRTTVATVEAKQRPMTYLVVALTLALLSTALMAGAQQSRKAYRIGLLSGGSPGPAKP